jgi:putative Mg2+ transporter-C (MgtC) family protein
MDVGGFEWATVGSLLLQILVASALAVPVAWDREHRERSAGLRTFPLVAAAACGYVILARAAFSDDAQAQARVLEGLITGIGFIGGGAIIKGRGGVRGTATAASIWATAAVGAATGYQHYELATVLALVNFGTLRLLAPLKDDDDDEWAGPGRQRPAGRGGDDDAHDRRREEVPDHDP